MSGNQHGEIKLEKSSKNGDTDQSPRLTTPDEETRLALEELRADLLYGMFPLIDFEMYMRVRNKFKFPK